MTTDPPSGQSAQPRLPLDGVTVVSLEQAVAAPYATRQLADLGARVIKIERPGAGDFARRYDDSVHGQSSYFVWINRSKESLTLDVRSPAGRELLDTLLGRADVFVQNLSTGAARRLGVDADTLSARFPQLISCAISGYGSDGPWSERKAYDMLIQCETGLVSITGTPDDPVRVGISVADIAAGMYAFTGVLTALYERATTGVARAVEISLFEALAEWMGSPAYYTQYGGRPPARIGTAHATIAPYGLFPTGDGGAIMLSIQHEGEWAAFCEIVLGDPGLARDPRFDSVAARVANRAAVDKIVADRLAALDAGAASELMDRANVANARYNSMTEFLAHPVLAERDRWRDVDTPGGPIRALLPQTNLSGVQPRMAAVPGVGEHTESILRELGCADQTIATLRRDNAI